MASGWNPRVWLPCIGVVSGWCCKEVYRYPRARARARLTCTRITSLIQVT